jgi:hypothetical protein
MTTPLEDAMAAHKAATDTIAKIPQADVLAKLNDLLSADAFTSALVEMEPLLRVAPQGTVQQSLVNMITSARTAVEAVKQAQAAAVAPTKA